MTRSSAPDRQTAAASEARGARVLVGIIGGLFLLLIAAFVGMIFFVHDEAQRAVAEAAREAYGEALARAGRPATITTAIEPAGPYYFAEAYHQQYLAKNPAGYCGLGGTGVACPIPGAGALSCRGRAE